MTRLILAGVVVFVLGICSGSTSRSVTSTLYAAATEGAELDQSRRGGVALARASADLSRRSAAALARAEADPSRRSAAALARAEVDPSRRSAAALARAEADLSRRSAAALARAEADLSRRSAAALARAEADDNWPQWRGPDGLGLAPASTYVDEWSADKNVAWKTAIEGRGHSSPVVWGNRIFLTTSVEGGAAPDGHKAPVHLGFDMKPGYLHADSVGSDRLHALKVLAFEARTGRLLWARTAYDGAMYDDRHRKNTYASSTMATDGTRVYAFFESAGLYCYDFEGNLLWKTSFGGIAKAGMGPGTSPVLFEDLVILQCDQEMGNGSFIVALDKIGGREVWRQERTTRRSWATPLIVRTPNRVELVASGAELVMAYDPRTGRELWRAKGVESHPIPSAVAGHGLVFFSAGSSAKRAMAVRLGAEGDLTGSPAIVWRYTKGTAYVPSPILLGQYLYLMTDAGLITCLDAMTGRVIYEGGRPPIPAKFTASLVAVGDTLLMTSEDGDTFAVKAGPSHTVVRTNPIGEPVYASLGLAGGTIYIRGERHLFAVKAGPSTAAARPAAGR